MLNDEKNKTINVSSSYFFPLTKAADVWIKETCTKLSQTLSK